MSGDEYQACFFWIQICKLFDPCTNVCKVDYEANSIKSFDDVVVHYSEPQVDNNSSNFYTDYYQIKFHVTNNGSFKWNNLMEPSFINAKTFSILQRLYDAQKEYAPNGTESRFIIVSPWNIHPDDDLASYISNDKGEIRINKLFQGGENSKAGKIRTAYKEHLNIKSNDELRIMLTSLRICFRYYSQGVLMELLNILLTQAGFEPIKNNSLINSYTSLIRKLKQLGNNEFSKNDIIKICQREGLYIGEKKLSGISIGIRSFSRYAENETSNMISFLDYFNGRYIKNSNYWYSRIYPELSKYFSKIIKSGITYTLFLDTHTTIAFASGYYLDPKVGAKIRPVQKSLNGCTVWEYNNDQIHKEKYCDWAVDKIHVNDSNFDVVLALNITHHIFDDVTHYIRETALPIRSILNCSIGDNCNHLSIKDGEHAWLLVNQISRLLKERTIEEKEGVVHIFAAAPNGFMFFLGQISRCFGRCIIYEFDFEHKYNGSYFPTLSFPIKDQ